MSEQPVLRIEQVEKRFGLVEAVKGVGLEIARGEFFALLGPSGSGKTTLLRIVSGLETPNRGRVEIGGRDRGTSRPARASRRISVEPLSFDF